MRRALGHPALQSAAGVAALLALSWPLLVFDRPIYVITAFFVVWSATIVVLFVLSRAPTVPRVEEDEEDDDGPALSESGEHHASH